MRESAQSTLRCPIDMGGLRLTPLSIDPDDFEYAPFSQKGGIGKVYQLFGNNLDKVLNELNSRLVA